MADEPLRTIGQASLRFMPHIERPVSFQGRRKGERCLHALSRKTRKECPGAYPPQSRQQGQQVHLLPHAGN
jgi:hypothetical protein